MKGFSGPFKQESTISNKEAKGINIENISAVQNKNGKNFVVEVGDNEYYDPNAKNNIGGSTGKWEGNYNDVNNKRDTILVNSSYKVGDLIDETEWETGEATKKKKSPMKKGGAVMPVKNKRKRKRKENKRKEERKNTREMPNMHGPDNVQHNPMLL